MLNAKALTELLSNNSDERLCKRWFLVTPNGTLLAYTRTNNIVELRRLSTKAVLLWREHSTSKPSNATALHHEDASAKVIPHLLRTLTVETESSNLIIRKVQPQLLLVLEGGVPPRRKTFE